MLQISMGRKKVFCENSQKIKSNGLKTIQIYEQNNHGRTKRQITATIHKSRGAVIWDPPKLIRRPFHVARPLRS